MADDYTSPPEISSSVTTSDSTPTYVAELPDSADDISSSGSNVCRDFLRNVCRRGSSCRFAHPADAVRRAVTASFTVSGVGRRPIVFCHDFQNAVGCRRGARCRFAHCTRLEEAIYRRTGLLPVGGVDRKLAVDEAVAQAVWRGETPICIDFLNTGNCRRAAGKCRYRHVSADEFERQFGPFSATVAQTNDIVNRKRKASSVDVDDDNDEDDPVDRRPRLGTVGSCILDPRLTYGNLGPLVLWIPSTDNARAVDDFRFVNTAAAAPCAIPACETGYQVCSGQHPLRIMWPVHGEPSPPAPLAPARPLAVMIPPSGLTLMPPTFGTAAAASSSIYRL